jgi:glyoxylase-like metal-dependent hydrolase (beta-lactamase superfamily II)
MRGCESMRIMKITQLSEHIFKCEFKINVPIHIPINIWLIEHEGDIYIVDTGLEGSVDAQIRVALTIGSPKAIFLTHGHSDHIQGVPKWLNHFDIPIYAHREELIYINGEEPYPNKYVSEKTGVKDIVQPLTEEVFEHLPIKYYLTPGHCPGHVVYHHEEDNILLAGDLFITSKDELHPPIRRFSVDMNENIDSGSIIDALKPLIISSSHGQDLLYNEDLYSNYKFKYRD